MAYKPIRMDIVEKIIEYHLNKTPKKKIARLIGISKNTVKSYIRRYESFNNLQQEQGHLYSKSKALDDLKEVDLEERYKKIISELGRVGVSRYLLWEEYSEDGSEILESEMIYSSRESYAIADFDLDGDADIVFGGAESVEVRLNDGTGIFEEKILLEDDATDYFIQFTKVYARDYDSDGDMDIFYLPASGGALTLRENLDGQGTFGPAKILFTDVITYRDVEKFQFTDLNRDGVLELVTGISHQILLIDNFTELHTHESAFPIIEGVHSPNHMDFQDLNNDGYSDLIVTDFVSHELS